MRTSLEKPLEEKEGEKQLEGEKTEQINKNSIEVTKANKVFFFVLFF